MGIGNELITKKERRYAPDANSVRCIFVPKMQEVST